MGKKAKKIWKAISFTLPLSAFVLATNNSAFAKADATGALKDAGIITQNANSDLSTNLDKLIKIVMTFGGFWIIACLVFAGAKLSASQGNAQNRTAGFIGIGVAAFGAWIIMKAYNIAGWIAGFN